MDTVDLIRCSRCSQHLDPEAFAPSHRKQGDWCRSCRKDYMHGMAPKYASRAKKKHAEKPRTCRGCGVQYVKWAEYKIGVARCRLCYNTYARELSYRTGKARGPKGPPRIPGPGVRPQTKRWKELRASVIAEETHCGICGEIVDKTLTWATDKVKSGCVDHIIPLAFGGDYYDRTNLRLAHQGCNAREGQKQLRQRYVEAMARVVQLQMRVAELEGRLFPIN